MILHGLKNIIFFKGLNKIHIFKETIFSHYKYLKGCC